MEGTCQLGMCHLILTSFSWSTDLDLRQVFVMMQVFLLPYNIWFTNSARHLSTNLDIILSLLHQVLMILSVFLLPRITIFGLHFNDGVGTLSWYMYIDLIYFLKYISQTIYMGQVRHISVYTFVVYWLSQILLNLRQVFVIKSVFLLLYNLDSSYLVHALIMEVLCHPVMCHLTLTSLSWSADC